MEKITFLVFAPVLGAILGSFSTMLIYRLHHEQAGIWGGRSRCPQCQTQLQWWNLIPIFSWILQRGKCAYCQKPIPTFYPVIELVFATIFFAFVHKFYSIELWWMLPLVFLLLVLFFYDLWFMEVDDRIVLPAILLVAVASFWRELTWQELWLAGVLGWAFYAAQYYLSGGRWVGAGDMRFGFLLGLIFGWQLLLVLFVAYIVGTITALTLVIVKGYDRQSALPMGAFLMPSALLFLYWGSAPWEWYLNYLGII